MSLNYYEILGLTKYCTQDEIKKAYKKLALKYHPDKNKDDTESKNKFQEISEAYSILNDDKKRKNYDMFGNDEEGFHFGNGNTDPFEMFNSIFKDHLNQFKNFEMNYENRFDIGGMVEKLSGGRGLGGLFNSMNIPNVHVKVQSYGHDMEKSDDLLKHLFPGNTNDQPNIDENIDEDIEDIEDIVIHIDTCLKDIYLKKQENITYTKDKIKKRKIIQKKIDLTVPLYHPEIILKGNGNETLNNKGNVVISFHLEDSDFKRVNDFDVFYEKKMEIYEYYKKKECFIQLPNEEIIYIKNVKGNQLIKIKNKGIPYEENKEWKCGDIYIHIKIEMPELDTLYDIVNELIEGEGECEDEGEDKTDEKEETEFIEVDWKHIFQD